MAATTATTIQEFIGNVVTSVDGIDSITIADREGVEILSAPSTKPSNDEQSDEQILTTIFSLTSDQCMKLPEFGACSFVLAGYADGKQLLQATDNPLVITIMADAQKIDRRNLLSVLDDVKVSLKELRMLFDQQQQPQHN
ncbi:hypothetical protein FOZ61_007142 [Perkinsus olseni]|uniref:Roadblock/LAMTOR2 domain-containing protein n=1 Tax=Perkinsus olseni TaxID=32597 RepID=A0A7J6LAM2_PEROL|nr:hypothetical protein FOZ61_007142 [Perkinsus olseni]KAF4665789.1 hypothetical protein FOL46_003472 [Perkinsus olseni]